MKVCVAPSAENWRERFPHADDEDIVRDLQLAWRIDHDAYLGPANRNRHHDWMNFRTATLREARRRGLDLSPAMRVLGK